MSQPNGIEFATTPLLSTGVSLHYAEQGDQAGEAIVFLHGYSDSWFSFSRILPLLSPEYHAFALTERGHGDSDKPECCYTVEDFAADVDAFMDALGIGKATLVGHSGGSFMAQRVALSYPHRVSRCVLIGSATTLLNNEGVGELGNEMLALEDPVPPEFVREFQESTIYYPVPEEFLETVVSESLKLPARVWRDYWEGVVLTVDHAARLDGIDVPTLILWGEQDALFPREEQERLAAAIPGATLKMYPETGHAVHWERPEWVVRDLEAFIRNTRPAR
jgi:non-heme chloroperoxidase